MDGNSRDVDVRRRALVGALVTAGATVSATSAAANTLGPQALTGRADPQGQFSGKVVLVTGATSGIGRRTAEAFAREGAKVMFCGRREALGRTVEAGIRAFGGIAEYQRCDVRRSSEVRVLVERCVERLGRLDIVFNNAGIFMTPGAIEDIDVENYLDIMATNAGGVFYGMKYAVPVMRRQGGGVIINMASVAAHKGFPNTAAYNASKHAIIGLTKAVATANGKHNIRVNSISPLAVDTPQLQESFAYQKVEAGVIAASFVTPRIMTTDEIASAVMFLASDQASSINGMDLDVTGGQLA